MADHVPAQAAGAQWSFCLRFLHLVLAEERQAQPGGFYDHFRRMAFGHCEQSDRTGLAPGSRAGRRDALLDRVQVGCQIHVTSVKREP